MRASLIGGGEIKSITGQNNRGSVALCGTPDATTPLWEKEFKVDEHVI